FQSGRGRAQHADDLDAFVGDWIAQRDLDEVVAAFEDADAAIAPIYDIAQVFQDPQYQALDTITAVEDPELGTVRMQNVLFRLSDTPGSIRWAGRPLGSDNKEVFGNELGLSVEQIEDLAARGIISDERKTTL
ncbi:CoA transferase, partial [Actinomycetota bacterium]